MSDTALIPRTHTDMDTVTLGDILARSGYFTDARDASQAIVKILAGRELGLAPIASMTGVHIIKGKPSLSASLMAAVIKRSGKYNYLVREHTAEKCVIEFFEGSESIGKSEFTKADAQMAGTVNMSKFPRNMLFARAMSNGAKWFCPDVFGGPIYTPDEMGAEVDWETGEIIDADSIGITTTHDSEMGEDGRNGGVRTTPSGELPTWVKEKKTPKGKLYGELEVGQLLFIWDAFEEGTQPAVAARLYLGEKLKEAKRPYSPDERRAALHIKSGRGVAQNDPPATQPQQGLIASKLNEIFSDQDNPDAFRHSILKFVWSDDSVKTLTIGQASATIDWLCDPKDDTGDHPLNSHAIQEAWHIIRQTYREAGQLELLPDEQISLAEFEGLSPKEALEAPSVEEAEEIAY